GGITGPHGSPSDQERSARHPTSSATRSIRRWSRRLGVTATSREPPGRARAPRDRANALSRDPTFVRVDGLLIRVSVRGDGRPLLLIMGLGGNIEMWAPLERALNARGVQTIAYDASGTGGSPARVVPSRMHG